MDNADFLVDVIDLLHGSIEHAEEKINDNKILENGKRKPNSQEVFIDGNKISVTRELIQSLLLSSLRAHFKI